LPPRAPPAPRFSLEFGFNVGDQVEIRELQQLDRLHQLRRHHQRLALADLESLRKRHGKLAELVRFLLLVVYSSLAALSRIDFI
jgi:hypothetical protein